MQEARVSINLGSILASLHPWDWHHRGPNTKPHFVCSPEALSRIPLKELAVPHQNPVSTTWILPHYFHLMKLRTEIVRGSKEHYAFFLLPASVTWAEINVESLIRVCFQRSDVGINPCTHLHSSRTEWHREGKHLSTFHELFPGIETLATC